MRKKMKKLLFFLLCLVPFSFLNAEKNSENQPNKKQSFLSYTANIEIQVIAPEKTQDEINDYLKKEGGYFINRSNYTMQAKLSPNKLLPFIQFLKGKGLVTSQAIENFNYQEKYQQYQVTIKTQEETLNNILKIFDQAGLYEALSIEQKLQQIMNEIEYAKGQVRYIEERTLYAYITLSFKSYAAQIKTDTRSPFPWINGLSLEKLFRK